MSSLSEFLRKHERMEVTLLTLLEYYVTSKKIKGCSSKTLIAIQSIMGRFIRFLEKRDHSLKLADLTIEDARDYIASLQGKITKYDGHTTASSRCTHVSEPRGSRTRRRGGEGRWKA
jgi:hypothetical protein